MGENKIHLTKNDELIIRDLETSEILNYFFFQKKVQNFEITRYSNDEPFLPNIKDSIIKAILK